MTAFLVIFISIDTLDHDTFVANVRLVPLIPFLLASFHFFFNDDQHSPLSVGPSSFFVFVSVFVFVSSFSTPLEYRFPASTFPYHRVLFSESTHRRIPCFDSHSVMQLVLSLQKSRSRFLYPFCTSFLLLPVFQLFDCSIIPSPRFRPVPVLSIVLLSMYPGTNA